MTVTQNYDNIIPSTPILSADPNVKEDVMTDQQKITILYCPSSGSSATAASVMRIRRMASRIRYKINASF